MKIYKNITKFLNRIKISEEFFPPLSAITSKTLNLYRPSHVDLTEEEVKQIVEAVEIGHNLNIDLLELTLSDVVIPLFKAIPKANNLNICFYGALRNISDEAFSILCASIKATPGLKISLGGNGLLFNGSYFGDKNPFSEKRFLALCDAIAKSQSLILNLEDCGFKLTEEQEQLFCQTIFASDRLTLHLSWVTESFYKTLKETLKRSNVVCITTGIEPCDKELKEIIATKQAAVLEKLREADFPTAAIIEISNQCGFRPTAEEVDAILKAEIDNHAHLLLTNKINEGTYMRQVEVAIQGSKASREQKANAYEHAAEAGTCYYQNNKNSRFVFFDSIHVRRELFSKEHEERYVNYPGLF